MGDEKITIIINTFKSDEKIHSCLDSISDEYKVVVVENSTNKGKPTYPSPIMAIFFWRVLLSMTYVLIFIKNDTLF